MFSKGSHGDQSFPAVVTKNDDPERRGRLKVTCSALLGDETREFPAWVEPDLPWGWFLIPDVGQQVTLTISLGSSADTFSGQSQIAGARPRWSGSYFTASPVPVAQGQGLPPAPSSAPLDAPIKDPSPVGSEFTAANYGKRRGFKTPRGHVFLFDDTQGQEKIILSWTGGSPVEPKTALLMLDSEGSFVVQDSGGSTIYMDGKSGNSSIVNQAGCYFMMGNDGISLVDQNNNALLMNDQGISFVSNKPISFAGSDHVFQSGLHFIEDGLTVNVGGIAASFHPATVAGIAMTATATAAVAIPGDPTWLDHLIAFNVTASL